LGASSLEDPASGPTLPLLIASHQRRLILISASCRTLTMRLQEIAERIGAESRGDGETELSGVAAFTSATSTDLIFLESSKYADAAVASSAGAFVVGQFDKSALKSLAENRPLLIARNPRLAFARAAEILRRAEQPIGAVHPTAVVDPTAQLGRGVSVGPGAFIGPRVVLGEDVSIGPACLLLSDVILGNQTTLIARVTIYPKTTLGQRCLIHAGVVLGSDGFGFARDDDSGRYEKFPQIGALVIGDDVEIGANTTIDRGALEATVIGNGVKIDNLVQIAHNVEIGDNVVIASQTGVSGSSVIERNCIVAGQVGIADHVRIEEGAILGAQCGVPTKKVIRGRGVVFWGTPARPIAEYLRELAALTRLARRKKPGE
jgi:UDP-3-O-[3-hydroxymyristoyl] glucosamine N-acyltransferase